MILLALGLVGGLAGCRSAPTRTPTVVPVSTVINLVKDELRFVSENMPVLEKDAGPGAARAGPGNKTVIKLEPKSAKVSLKTVSVKERNPTVGLTDPIGVISIDPSYSGVYSTGETQTLTIELGIPQSGKKGVELAALNLLGDAKWDDHRLAQAIIGFAKSLLDVDHTKLPCMKPGTLTANATFSVIQKDSTGVTFKLWIFKIGEKTTFTNEAHQVIELSFDLSKESSPLVPP
jgi:hypothetical protein